MGRSILFYAIAAAGLLIVAVNADDIEGRNSEASMAETLIVIGGALAVALVVRLLLARFAPQGGGRE
ncbi:hypothetical protein [Qipengyuania zhejiangensis]|uniref:hypothetical protein n=1 Tax=Qipengyuania zhejiangensis TaxID=3077782 RepID=UPI002D77B4AA|nr:hypothetical protein [Qipengyuania sp. Z2]